MRRSMTCWWPEMSQTRGARLWVVCNGLFLLSWLVKLVMLYFRLRYFSVGKYQVPAQHWKNLLMVMIVNFGAAHNATGTFLCLVVGLSNLRICTVKIKPYWFVFPAESEGASRPWSLRRWPLCVWSLFLFLLIYSSIKNKGIFLNLFQYFSLFYFFTGILWALTMTFR